jgi:hypothetical protein
MGGVRILLVTLDIGKKLTTIAGQGVRLPHHGIYLQAVSNMKQNAKILAGTSDHIT